MRNKLTKRRRGFTVVLVLGLLAITLGLSYSLLRTNTTAHELERNQSRKTDARTAAQTGMSIALRKLHEGGSSWSGADSTFTGNITSDNLQGFVVTYATGDSALTASSADWKEYPFRLSIESKGYSIDASTSASRSEYTIRTVVQLVRRKRNSSTATRTDLELYSIHQSGNNAVRMHYPLRLNNRVHVQGEIQFSREYPKAYLSSAYQQTWDDLRNMYEDNNWDYLPFNPVNGRIYTPTSRQPSSKDFWAVIDSKLKVPYTNVATSSTPAVPVQSAVSGYRLFEKGKEYSLSALPTQSDSANQYPEANKFVVPGTYQANMVSNPLGIFTVDDDKVAIVGGTTIEGLVMSRLASSASDLIVTGDNVTLTGPALPLLSGETGAYRLPVLMAVDDVMVFDGSNRTINGWVVAGEEFWLQPGASSTTLTVNGGVFSKKLYLDERTGWTRNEVDWLLAMTGWGLSLNTGLNKYFPGWLANNRSHWGIYLPPRLIFNATPSGITNHVPNLSQPIYVAHPDDDDKLQWDIVRWQEVGT